MSMEIQMPALSPTMEYGTLAKWLVKAGDAIKTGDVIAEIETDKATMELEADQDGVLASIVIAAGTEDVAVGHVIATLVAAGAAPSAQTFEPQPAEAPAPVIVAAAPPPAPAPPIETAGEVAQAIAPQITSAPTSPAPTKPDATVAAPRRMSPLARRLSTMHGIDVSGILGSGPKERVIKIDLDPYLPQVVPQPSLVTSPATGAIGTAAPIAAPIYPAPEGVPHETTKLSGMRKTIARRLTESKQTVPHFYLSIDVQLDELMALRAELNASLAASGIKISVNDLLIKGLGVALTRVPAANVQYAGDQLHTFSRADVSVAVAIDGGLITPVIRNAGSRSISDISSEMKSLAARARDGKLAPEDYQGGTASLSNLGMFGIREMFPVINPPQGLILGVGAAERRPIFVGDDVVGVSILTATGSFDHRAIDGAVAAEFMSVFKSLIESPLMMIV